MADEKRFRLRLSIRALMAVMALIAVVLGGWVGYSNYKIQRLIQLREQGAIVIIRDRTPKWLRTIGIKQLRPFYSVPTVELYVAPRSAGALVGNSEKLTSEKLAKQRILEMATEASNYGAIDVQLVLVDNFALEWAKFGADNSMPPISDSKERYLTRLKANQDSGKNVNP